MKKILISLLISFPVIAFSQNVGIGTTIPNRLLHIKGAGEVLRIQGTVPWIGFMNNTDPDYRAFLFYPDTSLVLGSTSGTNLPLIIAPNNLGLLYATSAQRIGIGSPAPTEKLDVNGNINVTGTIKANGVDGTANQVLMKNSSGLLSWGDMCEYKNYVVFNFTTSGAVQTFTVPAGITKIKAALWGGGGLGVDAINGAFRGGCGGGGGGYIEGYFIVTSATSVQVTVGSGANTTIPFSESSRIDVAGTSSLIALGGGNASFNSGTNTVFPGNGGGYVTFVTNNYVAIRGQDGMPSTVKYEQISATNFSQAIYHGDGGNAGNSEYTSGTGGFEQRDITAGGAVISRTNGTAGKLPGGGAAAAVSSASAGNGRVIIYY